jgi:hypothetical protein
MAKFLRKFEVENLIYRTVLIFPWAPLPPVQLRPDVVQSRPGSQPFELIARHRMLRRDFERLSGTRRDFDTDSSIGFT